MFKYSINSNLTEITQLSTLEFQLIFLYMLIFFSLKIIF